ncbi:MAG: CpsB/CapC family capsule biosynthesis tyrosine phosphatase [Lachnospiraceae bacterium]
MEGYIDMHCHILPDVDDGAKSVAEMEAMLRIAYRDGIRCIIATPHYHPRRGKERPEVIRRRAILLRDKAHAIDENFRIYLGTEIYFGQDIIKKIKDKHILTMNRRNYVLIEFSYGETFSYIKQSLQQIQFSGYEVILAHVERYDCIVENLEFAVQLWEMGIHLQVNAGSICGDNGKKIKKFVKSLMNEDLVFCVGTDAHGAKKRAPHMRKAAEHVKKEYGEEYARRIFFSNAMKMLRKIR